MKNVLEPCEDVIIQPVTVLAAPALCLMFFLEVLLWELVGKMKPVTFLHTPPGAIDDQIILPLTVLMPVLSLWSASALANSGAKSD